MIKYNIVVRCYDKTLVNMAAYVIHGYNYRSYGMWLLPYLMSVLPDRFKVTLPIECQFSELSTTIGQ